VYRWLGAIAFSVLLLVPIVMQNAFAGGLDEIDVIFTKDVDKSLINPGELVTYTYTLENLDPSNVGFCGITDDKFGLIADKFTVPPLAVFTFEQSTNLVETTTNIATMECSRFSDTASVKVTVIPLFDKNFVHAEWINPPQQLTPPTSFSFDTNSPFELFDMTTLGGFTDPNGAADCHPFEGPGTLRERCDFFVTNFVDDLDTKIIKMDIEFTGPGPTGPPSFACLIGDDFERVDFIFSEVTPNHETYIYECLPNPDRETVSIFSTSEDTVFTKVEFWTTSFSDEPPRVVGGELLTIDSTSLLVAGVQTNAAWLIPVVLSVLGIGLFVVSRKSE